MSRAQLIVNGDDFGFSEEVNEAVIRAFREGILTSCSLMVTGRAFDHAVGLAGQNEGLAVGIHLVTVMGRSVLPHFEIPTIVDREGNFSMNPAAAGLTYFFSRRARLELRRELAAQFEKFEATGLRLSHIDSHLHMHIHPVIFDAALRLAEQYGVKRMRVPEDDLSLAEAFDGVRSCARKIYTLIFWLLSRRMKKRLTRRAFLFTDRVYGNLMTGRMQEAYLLYLLDHLPAGGVSEIYFHPAIYDTGVTLGEEERGHMREAEILLSRKVIGRVGELNLELTNYLALKAAS